MVMMMCCSIIIHSNRHTYGNVKKQEKEPKTESKSSRVSARETRDKSEITQLSNRMK